MDEEKIEFLIESKKIKSDKHIKILRFLIENGEIPISDLELFTNCSRSIIKTLEKNGYLRIYEKQVDRNPFINKNVPKTSNLNLNEEQQNAFDEVAESIDMQIFSEFLLFGVTGSRKN